MIAGQGEGWLAPRPPLATRAAGYIGSLWRQANKKANSYRPGHKNSRAYSEHRFPGLSAAQVGDRLVALSELVGKFASLRARQIYPNVFVISK